MGHALLLSVELKRGKMVRWRWGLVIFIVLLAGLGCAAGAHRTGGGDYDAEGYPALPASFYDGDPAYRHWFTYPEYNPYMQRR